MDTGRNPAKCRLYSCTVVTSLVRGISHIGWLTLFSASTHIVIHRVLGDYLETLLYKIFVSIDENTTVAELAGVLEVEGALVREAVSIYCRLGFAKKKNSEMDSNDLHPSWYDHLNGTKVSQTEIELSSDWRRWIICSVQMGSGLC